MAGVWLERNDHPLLNDLILSNVFEYVRPTDLKETRVVSKKWNLSTIPFTRKTWRVAIYGNRSTNWDWISSGSGSRMIGKFVEVFSLNELGFPFARYRLGAFSMTDVVGQQFFKLCGDTAKEIDLSLDSHIFMIEDVSELLRSTPNLIKFHIPNQLYSRFSNVVKLFPGPEDSKPKLIFLRKLKFVGEIPTGRMKFCPTFFEELFLAAENVSNLTIGKSFFYMDENNGSLIKCRSLEVLNIIEKLKRESSIESLHFKELKEEHVEILRRMKSNGMKLKRIKVSDNFSPFIQVASIFKDSLEHFGMSTLHTSETSMKFPRMSHLTSLKIHVYCPIVLELSGLSTDFPVLEKLNIDQVGCYKEYDELFSESDPCPKMKSFKLRSCTMRVTSFNRTLTKFPRLTELYLQIGMNDLVLRNIWTQMTQLEVLYLNGFIQTMENLDSVFTGISAQSLQEIEPLVNQLEEMTPDLRGETIFRLRSQHRRLPSISNLTNLRRLEVDVRSKVDDEHGQNSQDYLTDLTGYLDFYGMKELRYIKIDQSKLTKSCCEILTTDTGLQSLESWIYLDPNHSRIIPSVAH